MRVIKYVGYKFSGAFVVLWVRKGRFLVKETEKLAPKGNIPFVSKCVSFEYYMRAFLFCEVSRLFCDISCFLFLASVNHFQRFCEFPTGSYLNL